MKKIHTLIIVVILFISCQSETKEADKAAPEKTLTERVADEAGKIISEDVYEINRNTGKKGGIVFIIEGNKLYAVNENGTKDLFLEKRGDKVYDFSNGQNGSSAVFFFEGDKYWEINRNTGEKGNLIFERIGNIIYINEKGEMKKAFIVD